MISVEENKKQCLVSLNGEMTIYTASQLKEAFAPVIFDEREMKVQLAGVNEIDSAGIQLLLMLRGERRKKALATGFSEPGAAVIELCELYRLNLGGVEPDSPAETQGEQHGA